MRKMRAILFPVDLTFYGSVLMAQTAQILYASSDLPNPSNQNGIRRIIEKPIRKSLILAMADGSTRRIPVSHVWGYVREDDTIFRSHKRDFYELISQKDSILCKSSCVLQLGRIPRVLTTY